MFNLNRFIAAPNAIKSERENEANRFLLFADLLTPNLGQGHLNWYKMVEGNAKHDT